MVATLSRLIILAADKKALRKAVFSKPTDKSIVKAVMSPITLGGAPCLQLEYFHSDNKATHKNISLDQDSAPLIETIIGAFCQVNVLTVLGDCEYRVSSKGKSALLGGDKLMRKLESAAVVAAEKYTGTNNREKRYILDGSEPFLVRLGVSDKNGRIYDKKQSKFR